MKRLAGLLSSDPPQPPPLIPECNSPPPDDHHQNYTSNSNMINPNSNHDSISGFNSSMAVTILVLLTALFFMGFFSVYVRRFSEENNAEAARRRRRIIAAAARRNSTSQSGLPPELIASIPSFSYPAMINDVPNPKDDDHQAHVIIIKPAAAAAGEKVVEDYHDEFGDLDCVVCLSEFEEGEMVKELPACRHVFHDRCIDTWLTSHSSCPLCRYAVFLPLIPPHRDPPHVLRSVKGGTSSTGVANINDDIITNNGNNVVNDTTEVVIAAGSRGGDS